MQIGVTAPTTLASFAQPFQLEVEDVQGETVLAHATVSVDCDLARTHVGQARAGLAKAERTVKALEGAGGNDAAALRAVSDARAVRFAIVQTWRENAAAVVQCSGGAAAQADLAAAERAVQATIVPPHTGMPLPPG
jgi:hypothetical protein